MATKEKLRCAWPADDALMKQYHDTEWGVPLHEDQKLFEFIILDAFQAGLSWRTILHKRENFRKAFADFDPEIVSKFTEKDIAKLEKNTGIIRNKRKIRATISNAECFLKVQKEFGRFDTYIWSFVDHQTIVTDRPPSVPAGTKSPESEAMSKDLKKRGFKFVGPTICYAFMQAAGMIHDHVTTCFRKKEIDQMLEK